jgi:hydroxyacylglutathione hydrolase
VGFTEEHPIPVVDEGLGNSAYLADLGDGRALAVDASRDLRALRETAARRGLRVAFAADTHLHADFLTGAVQLAADEGATVLAAAAGHRAFPHTPLADGDEMDLGGLTLRALATPGHTGEHLSYLLLDGSRELGVFTGGSLIVGSAARTDLLGADRAGELARAQYRSLRRLATLPDATEVWPTHGAGSFCSALPRAARVSTIGTEKASNALLAAPDEDAFARLLPAGVPLGFVLADGQDPAEVAWQALKIGYENLAGQLAGGMAAWQAHGEPTETTGLVTASRIGDRPVLDVRQATEYESGHIPGAVHVELGDLPARIQDAPAEAMVMCGHGERAMTAASLLQRAGHRWPTVLAGGPQDWAAVTGQPLREGA